MAGPRARRARRPPSRSQHFLRTEALAAALVRDAGVGPHDLVLDLGAGTGRLTRELAAVARGVVAVEVDATLARGLRGRWANVDVVEADATTFALPREPFRVVANIPFDRTGELLRLLLDDPSTPLVRADLVVEWGVAVKRALPWPSSVSSVFWGAFYETRIARRIPRGGFSPPPSVDAGVLVFRRRDQSLVPLRDGDAYGRFVARGFRHGLRSVVPARWLDATAGRDALARDLDAAAWADLYRRTSGRPTLHKGRSKKR